jgi:hypothetical protein
VVCATAPSFLMGRDKKEIAKNKNYTAFDKINLLAPLSLRQKKTMKDAEPNHVRETTLNLKPRNIKGHQDHKALKRVDTPPMT